MAGTASRDPLHGTKRHLALALDNCDVCQRRQAALEQAGHKPQAEHNKLNLRAETTPIAVLFTAAYALAVLNAQKYPNRKTCSRPWCGALGWSNRLSAGRCVCCLGTTSPAPSLDSSRMHINAHSGAPALNFTSSEMPHCRHVHVQSLALARCAPLPRRCHCLTLQ